MKKEERSKGTSRRENERSPLGKGEKAKKTD
jgi:hypothetical protein